MTEVYVLKAPGTREDVRELLTSEEVAAIWTEMAHEMGYPDAKYTRHSVRARRANGNFAPAMKTKSEYLYREEDARAIKLWPQKSRTAKKAA